jgi:hypothetical protein
MGILRVAGRLPDQRVWDINKLGIGDPWKKRRMAQRGGAKGSHFQRVIFPQGVVFIYGACGCTTSERGDGGD